MSSRNKETDNLNWIPGGKTIATGLVDSGSENEDEKRWRVVTFTIEGIKKEYLDGRITRPIYVDYLKQILKDFPRSLGDLLIQLESEAEPPIAKNRKRRGSFSETLKKIAKVFKDKASEEGFRVSQTKEGQKTVFDFASDEFKRFLNLKVSASTIESWFTKKSSIPIQKKKQGTLKKAIKKTSRNLR